MGHPTWGGQMMMFDDKVGGWGLGCANKDLDGSLGPLGKFIEYCRIAALLPVTIKLRVLTRLVQK